MTDRLTEFMAALLNARLQCNIQKIPFSGRKIHIRSSMAALIQNCDVAGAGLKDGVFMMYGFAFVIVPDSELTEAEFEVVTTER